MRVQRLLFEWQSFISALGLLSRIPVQNAPCVGEIESRHRARAQVWYPWVGLVLGGILASCAWLLPDHWVDLVSAAFLLVFWILLTGALHLDGLADSADAWIGGMGDSRRTLRIMKDPNAGPAGVTALVGTLLLKLALIVQLLQCSDWFGLMLVTILARAWLLPLLGTTEYARAPDPDTQSPSAASDLAHTFPVTAAVLSFSAIQLIACALSLASSVGLSGWLLCNLCALSMYWALRRAMVIRLGGYTGDLLGAFIELEELAVLSALVFFPC